MSTPDLRVALTTSLNDKLVAPLRRSLDEVEKNLQEVEKELQKTTTAGTKASTTLAGIKGPEQATKQAADLARETQRAIGLADRLRSAWSATSNMVKGVAQGVAAFQAARMVVAPSLQQERVYGRQLADASNTAYADRDTAGRVAGMRDLDATVTASMRAGGGKREDILGALNEMLASGSVSPDQAKNLLPTVSRYAAAGNANVGDLSTIVVRALQNGFKEADIPRMLDMALAAGQAGGFELKDMAKWLPKFLAAGPMSGLTGIDGYARILASAQGSVITAGSKDEAGNNLQNLLLKINSSDTAQDAKKLGIDLSGSLAAARDKGVNSLDAFVNLVDQIAGKDPRMVALRKRTAAAGSDEERRESLNAQADILQGSAIGKIVQDRQALMPLIAELNKRDYIMGVLAKVKGAKGQYGDSNFALVSSTNDFKVQQQENERLIAQTNGLGGANTAIAKLSEYTTDLYRKYPSLGEWMENTIISLKGLAAAAAGAGAAALLLGGSGAKGLLGRGVAAAAGGGATAAAAAAGGAAAAAGGAAKLGMLARGLGAANPLLLLEALTGPSDKDIATLREQDRAKSGFRGKGFSDPRLLGIGEGVEGAQREAAGKRSDEMAQVMARLDQTMQEVKALSLRPVLVTLDGHEIASATNNQNAFEARRN